MFCKVVHNLFPKVLNHAKFGIIRSISCTSKICNTNTSPSSSTLTNKSSSNSSVENPVWIPIYHLPVIHIAAAFNKLKIYQYALTLITTPVSFYAESIGQLAENSALIVAYLGITGSITLTLCSLFTRNLIGIVYLKQNSDELRIAYIDFWGKRQHFDSKIDDIVLPEENNKQKLKDYYQLVRIANEPKQKFILLKKYGMVSSQEKFSYIFGD